MAWAEVGASFQMGIKLESLQRRNMIADALVLGVSHCMGDEIYSQESLFLIKVFTNPLNIYEWVFSFC